MLVIILLQWLLTSTADSTLVLSRMQEFEPIANQTFSSFPIELFQDWKLSFEVFVDSKMKNVDGLQILVRDVENSVTNLFFIIASFYNFVC